MLGIICGCHDLIAPARLDMFSHVPRGVCIFFIEEAPDLSLAPLCQALEGMCSTAIDCLNDRSRIKKCIDR